MRKEFDKASHLVSLYGNENLPAIKAELANQAEVSSAIIAENIKIKQQLESIQAVIEFLQRDGLRAVIREEIRKDKENQK